MPISRRQHVDDKMLDILKEELEKAKAPIICV
jgi:hypothetical protein